MGEAARTDRRLLAVAHAALPSRRLFRALGADHVVAAWVRYQREEAPADAWASHLAFDVGEWDLADARDFVERLAVAAPDDEVLAMVAAVPLEEFVRSHGDESVDWIEEQARRDVDFRRALRHAWLWNKVSDAAFDRIQAAAGVPLAHPRRDRPGG